MNKWQTADPKPLLLGCVAILVVVLLGIQFATTQVVAAVVHIRPRPLSLVEYLGLWGTRGPATRYGAPEANWLHMIVLLILIGLIIAVTALIIRLLRKRITNPEYLPGLAHVSDVIKHTGRKQLMQRAHSLRPLLSRPAPADVGFLIATYRHHEVWVSVEDPMILVGPSRSGKGFYFVVEMIVKAPGAVVATSCKVDNVKLTMTAREAGGKAVFVFAPGVESANGLGHHLRWNPILGCGDSRILERRITSLIPKDSYGSGTTNGGHWDTVGRQLATALFHAAALGNKTVDELWAWVVSAVRAQEAVDIIRAHPHGIEEVADSLASVLDSPGDKRDSEWSTLKTVLAWMESRAVRECLKPTVDGTFDIATFLLNGETLFMVGNEDGSGGYQQIVGALIAEINYVAEGIAAAMPGSRLDPSVSFVLDEAANFHINSLPSLISAGGGVGKQVVAVFQSKSQMAAWGPENERSMWDAAAVKIVLPGGSDEQDLRGLSALIGEHTQMRESFSRAEIGGRSSSWAEQERPIMTAADIRTMPKGTALIFHREMKVIVGRLTSWLELADAQQMKESEKALSLALRANSQYAHLVNAHIDRAKK